MAWGTKFLKSAAKTYSAPAAATGLAAAITWSSNEPTTSYTYTIADGDGPTSTEIGIALKTSNTQITALIADVLALRTSLLANAADIAALKVVVDEGE